MRPLILAALCGLSFATEGHAQGCASRDVIVRTLEEEFGEAAIWQGLTQSNGRSAVTELWVNPQSQTWTVTQSTPDGQTCMATSGTGYNEMSFAAPASGDPA